MIRYQLLGLLRSGEPRDGDWLARECSTRTGGDDGPERFHRELRTLARTGQVQIRRDEKTSHPRRARYQITRSGLEGFDQWFKESFPGSIDEEAEIAVWTLLLAEGGRDQTAALVASWLDEITRQAQSLQSKLGRRLARSSRGPDAFAALLRRRLRHLAADHTFLDDLYEEFDLPRPKDGHVESCDFGRDTAP